MWHMAIYFRNPYNLHHGRHKPKPRPTALRRRGPARRPHRRPSQAVRKARDPPSRRRGTARIRLGSSRRTPGRQANQCERCSGVKPQKRDPRASAAVNAAIKAGILQRPKQCPLCGSEKRIVAHHESYDPERWLSVEWMCDRCHLRMHSEREDLNGPGRPQFPPGEALSERIEIRLNPRQKWEIERAAGAQETWRSGPGRFCCGRRRGRRSSASRP